jgi:hypothetical protein
MSFRGRLILVNSCLSSIPTYLMCFYHLTDGQHRELDSIRGRFFWQGGGPTFKYHMAKWECLATPREYGGLGIIDTRRLNDCLLIKWIWKIVNKEDSMWSRLLYKKYMQNKDFFPTKGQGVLNFGRVYIKSNTCLSGVLCIK